MIGKDLQRRIQESYNSEEKDFQKNEELLDIVSRVCLLVPRQLKMELQENYFNLLIQGYKAYVMQTYTDTTKTEKLIIIADLKSILGSDGQDFPKKMNSIEKKLMKTKISYVKIHGEPCS